MPDPNHTPEPADALSLAEVAADCHVQASTVQRCCLRGLRLPGGKRLKLKAERNFGRWTVSRTALDEFRAEVRRAFEPVGATT